MIKRKALLKPRRQLYRYIHANDHQRSAGLLAVFNGFDQHARRHEATRNTSLIYTVAAKSMIMAQEYHFPQFRN
jgi:hypothetical protein